MWKFQASRSPKSSKNDPYNLKKKIRIYISITHIHLKVFFKKNSGLLGFLSVNIF